MLIPISKVTNVTGGLLDVIVFDTNTKTIGQLSKTLDTTLVKSEDFQEKIANLPTYGIKSDDLVLAAKQGDKYWVYFAYKNSINLIPIENVLALINTQVAKANNFTICQKANASPYLRLKKGELFTISEEITMPVIWLLLDKSVLSDDAEDTVKVYANMAMAQRDFRKLVNYYKSRMSNKLQWAIEDDTDRCFEAFEEGNALTNHIKVSLRQDRLIQ